MDCIGLVWSPAHHLFTDIIDEINNHAVVNEQCIYDLKTQVRSFIYNVYGDKNYILLEDKICSIEKCKLHEICIVKMQISDELFWDKQKNYIYNLNALHLKKHIRKMYSSLIDCYIYDNLFHLTMNKKEYQFAIRAINLLISDKNL